MAAEKVINQGLAEAEHVAEVEANLKNKVQELEARLAAAQKVHTPDTPGAAALPSPTVQPMPLPTPPPAPVTAVPVAAPPPPPPPPLPVVAVPAAALPEPPEQIVEEIFSYAGGAPPIEQRDSAYKELLAEYTAGTAPPPSPPAYGSPNPERLAKRQEAIRGAIRHTWCEKRRSFVMPFYTKKD
jgi:hypothetical protein